MSPDDASVTAPDPLVGALVGSRYRVVRELGRGGMAVVYLGEHEELGRRVAIKVIRPELQLTEHGADRFLREARTASQLSHPALVDVFDLGRLPDGRPFMVMPFLKGRDLLDFLHQEGPQPPSRVAAMLALPAAGLDAMHARSLVHRDIKPENLFVEERDAGPVVRIMDFGLAAARGQGSRLTQHGMVIGTPHYLSPEVASGTKADVAADIYALATVAYELIAGVVPFDHPEPVRILALKMVQDAPRVSEAARRKLPAAVDEVFARALARHPEDRHRSCGELIEALRVAAEDVSSAASSARTSKGAGAPAVGRLADDRRPNDAPGVTEAESSVDVGVAGSGTQEVPLVFSEPPPPPTDLAAPLDADVALSTSRPHGSAPAELAPRGDAAAPSTAHDAHASTEDGELDPSTPRDAHVSTEVTRLPQRRLSWAIPLIAAALAAIGLWVVGVGRGPRPDTARAGDAETNASALIAREPAAPETEILTAELDDEPAVERRVEQTTAANAEGTLDPTADQAPPHERRGRPRTTDTRADTRSPSDPRAAEVAAEAPRATPMTARADEDDRPARSVVDLARATELTNEGNQLALRGLLPAAIDRYRDATLAAPRHAPAWRGLGIANERMNRVAEARQAYERYLRIAPTAADADRIRQRLESLP